MSATPVSNAKSRELLTPDLFRSAPLKERRLPGGCFRRKNGPGIFLCSSCGNALFSTRELYPAMTVWPVFWSPIAPDRVRTRGGMFGRISRLNVFCGTCDALLGYLFEDGRPPTGSRYFISTGALRFAASHSSAERRRQQSPGGTRTVEIDADGR